MVIRIDDTQKARRKLPRVKEFNEERKFNTVHKLVLAKVTSITDALLEVLLYVLVYV